MTAFFMWSGVALWLVVAGFVAFVVGVLVVQLVKSVIFVVRYIRAMDGPRPSLWRIAKQCARWVWDPPSYARMKNGNVVYWPGYVEDDE